MGTSHFISWGLSYLPEEEIGLDYLGVLFHFPLLNKVV